MGSIIWPFSKCSRINENGCTQQSPHESEVSVVCTPVLPGNWKSHHLQKLHGFEHKQVSRREYHPFCLRNTCFCMWSHQLTHVATWLLVKPDPSGNFYSLGSRTYCHRMSNGIGFAKQKSITGRKTHRYMVCFLAFRFLRQSVSEAIGLVRICSDRVRIRVRFTVD